MAKAKSTMALVGTWSYVVGMLIAVILGLWSLYGVVKGAGAITMPAWTVLLLVALGFIVGFLNVSDNEAKSFLLASIAFVVAASQLSGVFTDLGGMWNAAAVFANAIVLFTAPGALVVAFKVLFSTASDN